MFKVIIQFILKFLAKLILAKYKPDVMGITGSVGKTSAKEAIYAVLSRKFRARESLKNYNNEIGLPLAVIGADSPKKSIVGWLAVVAKALGLILFKDKNYPEILILEMGVDRPGDMKYLLGIVKCKTGVITALGHSHLEFFGATEKIKKEKGLLIKSLPPDGWAILNYDDEKTRELKRETKARVLTYGLEARADVRAAEIKFSENLAAPEKVGVSFKLVYNGSAAPVFLPLALGRAAARSALAGACLGVVYGLNLVEISEALKNFRLPVGRMNFITGIKNTFIIDDTYNSSPQSAVAALEAVAKIKTTKGARKFAVLGDMLELGNYTEEGHRQAGEEAAKSGMDKLIAVGERARHIANGAREAGMNDDDIFHFSETAEAGLFLQDKIREGDLILVKGSQGMRMEKIVKEIMAEPLRAPELLVRQDFL